MKLLFLTSTFCLIAQFSHTQTYITPKLGYDFMSMQSVQIDPNFNGFWIYSPPYSIQGLHYTLEINQTIYKKIGVSAYLGFGQRKVGASTYGIAGFDNFIFDNWRANASINYQFTPYLAVGAGYDYNQLRDLTLGRQEYTSPNSFRSLLIDRGWNVNATGSWRNIELQLHFHKGLNSNIARTPSELSIKPIDYFGFSLGYRLKVAKAIKWKKEKKEDCPKF